MTLIRPRQVRARRKRPWFKTALYALAFVLLMLVLWALGFAAMKELLT